MSGWRLATRSLYEAGGGPLSGYAFDPHTIPLGGWWHGIHRAEELGLMRCLNPGKFGGRQPACLWELTQAGIDWCEGRVAVEYQPTKRQQVVATWLKALPRAGEIRMGA